jgi:hypothetical protein
MAAESGPNVLFCMPNMTKCILLVSVMHALPGRRCHHTCTHFNTKSNPPPPKPPSTSGSFDRWRAKACKSFLPTDVSVTFSSGMHAFKKAEDAVRYRMACRVVTVGKKGRSRSWHVRMACDRGNHPLSVWADRHTDRGNHPLSVWRAWPAVGAAAYPSAPPALDNKITAIRFVPTAWHATMATRWPRPDGNSTCYIG